MRFAHRRPAALVTAVELVRSAVRRRIVVVIFVISRGKIFANGGLVVLMGAATVFGGVTVIKTAVDGRVVVVGCLLIGVGWVVTPAENALNNHVEDTLTGNVVNSAAYKIHSETEKMVMIIFV